MVRQLTTKIERREERGLRTAIGHLEIQKGPVGVKWGQHPRAANPELDTLGKVADALGVRPGELLEE